MKLVVGVQAKREMGVSVSADGSKGVKLPNLAGAQNVEVRFSIRRWIEGCEAAGRASPVTAPRTFQYPQMDRRV